APATFDSRLRAFERRLAARGIAPAQPRSGARLFAEPQVGDTEQFWVLNSLEATD
ncbi:MAG: hypothetical protein GTN89_08080, partial [Acidobacteria bacterium]|nr:hypothetical protein [Acidobacteriota bacterium]NIQ30314.1 hypothetical protein [Acidobacteriota bacterium]NIQ84934.1 hypothetical protein [Acidobacteriota bacterium]